MNTTQNITLDLTKRTVFQCVSAKQGDNGSRFVKITLTDNGVVYKPPAGTAASFRAQKPDGTAILNPAVVNGDGTVTVELTQQTLAVCGGVSADVCLMDKDGTRLSTVSFIIHVENAPVGEQIDSTNEFLELLEIIERAENVTGDFSSALDQLTSIKDEAVEASTSAGKHATAANASASSAGKSAAEAQKVADAVSQTVTNELEQAKNSGKFDGPKGDKGDPGDGFYAEDDGQGNVTIISTTEVVYSPMRLGVEYKTPEYWDGHPVYTKLMDFGRFTEGKTREPHVTPDIDKVIRCFGTTGDGESIPCERLNTGEVEAFSERISVCADRTFIYITTNNVQPTSSRSATVQMWYTKREG